MLAGSDTLQNLLQGKDIYLSFITELELIGFKEITSEQENQISELLVDCSIIPMNKLIKEKHVELRKKYRLKLADAIIAASAIVFDMPIITADKHFKVITELDLIEYHHSLRLADPENDHN